MAKYAALHHSGLLVYLLSNIAIHLEQILNSVHQYINSSLSTIITIIKWRKWRRHSALKRTTRVESSTNTTSVVVHWDRWLWVSRKWTHWSFVGHRQQRKGAGRRGQPQNLLRYQLFELDWCSFAESAWTKAIRSDSKIHILWISNWSVT